MSFSAVQLKVLKKFNVYHFRLFEVSRLSFFAEFSYMSAKFYRGVDLPNTILDHRVHSVVLNIFYGCEENHVCVLRYCFGIPPQ